jgi:hypothetical protein
MIRLDFSKLPVIVFLIVILVTTFCSKDDGINSIREEDGSSYSLEQADSTLKEPITESIQKLKQFTALLAEEWNDEVQISLSNSHKDLEKGMELSSLFSVLNQNGKQNAFSQHISEYKNITLASEKGSHPIEIYIPTDHLKLLDFKIPIFVYYDGQRDETENAFAEGFTIEGDTVKVSTTERPKDQPCFVVRYKEDIESKSDNNSEIKKQERKGGGASGGELEQMK